MKAKIPPELKDHKINNENGILDENEDYILRNTTDLSEEERKEEIQLHKKQEDEQLQNSSEISKLTKFISREEV